jgi:serine/threonine-protein kinase RsbW
MAEFYTADFAIPSDLAGARRIQEQIETALQASAYSERDIFSMKLALEEDLVKAIKCDIRGFVICRITPDRFEIKITEADSSGDAQ